MLFNSKFKKKLAEGTELNPGSIDYLLNGRLFNSIYMEN